MCKKPGPVLCLFCLLLVLIMAGCESGTGGKAVRRRNVLKDEPQIIVELANNQEKKLGLEEYITGVVAGEMKPDWPENAYAAQTIIARTFALKYLSDNKTNRISGSYQFAQEYRPEKITPEIREAVKKTRGEVIVYKDEYINAWFHASAGGQTTSAKVGLGFEKEEPPYIISVKSPDEEAPADIKNWEVIFADSEIIRALQELGYSIDSLSNIEIVDKDQTGRVVSFMITGGDDSITVKASEFRNALDPQKLKSTKISGLKRTAGGFAFKGSGYGHGVGMSQWGAYKMAREKKSPEEIVSHYYKDVEIVKEYD
ncbi:MAG: SpoIID/LytB domain-containing protein [Halanaerobiaceae bacterium]|nr:SpoIID/LytB domain-containing protein [Halanaerobiaceae bacterium]